VHDIGVVLTGEDIAGATHIGSKLIDLIESAIDHGTASTLIPQIRNDEIVGYRFCEWWIFEIDASDPEALAIQTLHKMTAYESACTKNQSRFGDHGNIPA